MLVMWCCALPLPLPEASPGHACLLVIRWGHHPEQCHSEKLDRALWEIRTNLNAAAVGKVVGISAER